MTDGATPDSPFAAVGLAAIEPLPGGSGFPWYDARKDELKRLNVKPPSDFANRQARWRPGGSLPSWSFPTWLRQVLEVLGWTLVIALVVLVFWLIVQAFLQRELGGLSSAEGELEPGSDRTDDARIDQLPFALVAGRTDLLAEARRFYELGDYDRAIIYLYSYLLVQLDRRQLIRLTKGKTNRQYLREIRARVRLHSLVQTTMLAFEDVFFGGHHLEGARFEVCWRAVPDFQQQLEEAAA